MGSLKVSIPDELEMRFRRAAMERFGYSKGALSEAAQVAFAKFAEPRERYSKEIAALGDPIKAISGLLKHVKKSSVEIQHDIGKIRSERYARHRR